jgi:STE24 endopeptidase
MTLFDPRAATESLLAALPTAARLKAVHYTQGSHWLLLWGCLVTITACLLIARLRLLPALTNAIQRRRPRPWLFAFLAVVAFSLVDFALELPWASYAQWGREKAYGLTSQAYSGWLAEQMLAASIGALLAGVVFMLVYALIRRSPRRWWLWSGGLAALVFVVMMILGPTLIEPLFNTYTPAPPGRTRDAVVALARDAEVPSDKIFVYNGSKQSNRYTANVAGLFGSARVAMSDVMFARGADIAEVRGVVGHEMGHYKRGHVVYGAIFFSVLALAYLGLAQLVFPVVDAWMRTGATSIADPVGFPTISVLIAVFSLAATPLLSTATRLQESDADAFSLRVAHEPTGLAKALVKTIQYRADSPSVLEEALFYDHPSVRRRVQRAMDWKAAHLSEAESQEAVDAAASR